MKQNNTLEFLKFFAALLITNSHLGSLYGPYSALATGGAIGNALFFFCSGFGLSMSRFDRFDNWYKRRFFRVMPSILSKGILCSLLGLGTGYIAVYQLFTGGGWFFNAIMIFYVAIYILQLFNGSSEHFYWISFLVLYIITTVMAFYTIEDQGMIYTGSAFKEAWPGYFSTMLHGFVFGKTGFRSPIISQKIIRCILVLIVSIAFYYGVLSIVQRLDLPASVGIFSLVPLYITLLSWYSLGDCNRLDVLYNSRWWFPMKFIASLCWEIYLAQLWIVLKYTDVINQIFFPLNIVVCFILIIACAYVIKVLGRFIVHLFNVNSFDWNNIVKVWNR